MTFAECFQIVHTDHAAYGRLPATIAQCIAALRMAFGDFSIVDPYYTFDYVDAKTGEYKRDIYIVVFTFLIFALSSFMLFMVFMNFLIAVIAESYTKVRAHAVAHDYK